MAEIKDTSSLEAMAVRFLDLGMQIKQIEEEREKLKFLVGEIMTLSNQDEYRFAIDHMYDIKIKQGFRKAKIVDKRELANDMGVAESNINLEFLLKSVDAGKLSYETYKRYVHVEDVENTAIRKVNPL